MPPHCRAIFAGSPPFLSAVYFHFADAFRHYFSIAFFRQVFIFFSYFRFHCRRHVDFFFAAADISFFRCHTRHFHCRHMPCAVFFSSAAIFAAAAAAAFAITFSPFSLFSSLPILADFFDAADAIDADAIDATLAIIFAIIPFC
jgi:hypothetical protein